MNPTNKNNYSPIISWVSAISVITGSLVVIGWVLDIKILRTIRYNYGSMKFNAAVGFILLGISLLLIIKNSGKFWILFAKIISIAVFLIGALTFLQELFDVDFGIDQLLMNDFEHSGAAAMPGRMSNTAAINFTICGFYLLFFDVRNNVFRLISHWLLHVVTLISFIAIVGYLYNIPVFYKLSFITSMAVHTSVSFFLLSIAIALINPSVAITGIFTEAGIGNVMARKIFFQLTIAIVIIGYLRILTYHYKLIDEDLGIALYTTTFILLSLVLIGIISFQLNKINAEKLAVKGDLLKIETFLNTTPDPIIIVNNAGIIQLINDETEKHFGYSKQEIIGKSIALLIPERFINGPVTSSLILFKSLIYGALHSKTNLFALRKDGKEFPVEITTNSIQTKEGVFVSAAIRDISERKRQEKKITEMTNIISNSSDAIFSRDLKGIILSWNNGAQKLLGYEANEIIGNNISIFFPEEAVQERIAQTNKIFANQHIDQHETIVVRKDGSFATVSITMSPILDEQEKVIAVSLILRDISAMKAIQNAQKESSERNKLFIQQAPHAIAMFDANMNYLSASEKWIQDYGLTGKEIIGHSHYEIFPEIGNDWKAIHQMCLKGEINKSDEAKFERADGSNQWITWDVRPWYISQGNIGGLLMCTVDITALKQKDQEKRKMEAILDRTSEVARIGSWEVDILNNKVSWSRITKEIHEVTMDYELDISSGINFFKEGKSRQKIETAFYEAIKNGTDYDLELEIVTAKGRQVWTRAIGQAEFKDGVCKRVYGTFQDIDDTIKSRKALQKLNSELNTLLNAGYVSIIGTDNDGLITYFNKGAEMLLQYEASEMIGIHTPEIIHLQTEVIERASELTKMYSRPVSDFEDLREIARQKNFDSSEWTYVRKDGSLFPVQLVVTTVRNEQGEPMGFLGVATDISDIKKIEKKLLESNKSIQFINKQLNQKNEELEQFAFVAAHDLQEPLRMISGFLSLLEQKYASQLDDKGKQYIRYSVEGALRMRDLIRDILDFSKSGILNDREMDLNWLVQDIANNFKNDEKYQSAIIEVDELPLMKVDESAMKQLFTNLIGNALKYQHTGNIPVIKVSVEDLNDKWLFKIADNGIGIDPNQYDKVFAIFKRLHPKSAYSGTGIGLATCKKIVRLYNGDIWIESNNDFGSIFCFTMTK